MPVGSDVISATVAARVADTNLFKVQRAVLLNHASEGQPACFIARFPGSTGEYFDVLASGQVSETAFTTEAAGDQYLDEPTILFRTSAGASQRLMLAQESQTSGLDVFACVVQPGLQPAPGMDTHRLESIELLLRRGTGVHPGSALMSVAPVTSYILDIQGGTIGTEVALPGNLNAAAADLPIKAVVGMNVTGRFLSFRLVGDNLNSLFKYLGAILRGHRVA